MSCILTRSLSKGDAVADFMTALKLEPDYKAPWLSGEFLLRQGFLDIWGFLEVRGGPYCEVSIRAPWILKPPYLVGCGALRVSRAPCSRCPKF